MKLGVKLQHKKLSAVLKFEFEFNFKTCPKLHSSSPEVNDRTVRANTLVYDAGSLKLRNYFRANRFVLVGKSTG
jgi:hypothetical protein